MVFFLFLGTSMLAFLILASGCEVYSSLFSSCCLSRGGNKVSIKFAGKTFKPTSFVYFINGRYFMDSCIFFVLTYKLKPKIQITRTGKKIPLRILPWLQFD